MTEKEGNSNAHYYTIFQNYFKLIFIFNYLYNILDDLKSVSALQVAIHVKYSLLQMKCECFEYNAFNITTV